MSSCMADPRTSEHKPIRAMAMAMATSSGYGCYSDVVSSNSHMVSHLQSFEQNPAEIYNLTAGMGMIGFPPNHQHDLSGVSDHHHQTAWSSNNLGCVFTCEGNERPSQGLSLSLSSSNPSGIGLQSFELRQGDDLRFGPSSSRSHVSIQHEEQSQVMMQGQFLVRESKYLGPAQELLYEFCNLGTKHDDVFASKGKHQKTSEGGEDDQNAARKQSLYSLDFLELQRRKARLLHMVEEVDRRYRHYCNQMKTVVSSFEAVAGEGAATVYLAMASRAMSRHFRCLRDGIVNQIKLTKKAMGDKDTAAPGSIKGETPRLRLLDQSLRQQRALQQMSMMESHPWRPQRGLPERSVSILRAWLFEHFLHPYPSDVDKHILARQTGLSRSQVSNWFINARVRLWKPMVEEMYLEELKEQEAGATGENNDMLRNNHNHSTSEDQKPTHDQLIRIDSECLSSIISNTENNMNNQQKNKGIQNEHNHHHHRNQCSFGNSSYGAMELDFSSYGTQHPSAGGAGGVSLTLGLHQNHGASNGVSLAFSPGPGASQGPSMFYASRDHQNNMEDCQTVHYSLLDSDSQTLPYRNLMEAQLLHDLAG